MKLLVSLFTFLFSVSTVVFAAPVTIPVATQGLESSILSTDDNAEDMGFGVSIGAEADLVDRDLEFNQEAEGDFYGGRVTLTVNKNFDFYGSVGQASGIEYTDKSDGTTAVFGFDDKVYWAVGLSGMIYEFKDAGVSIFGDVNYRKVSDIGYESLTVDGVRYSKSQLTGINIEAEWKEWQAALGASKKFDFFTPYAGVKYSDIDASAKATINATTYDLGTANADKTIGAFVGVAITPIKSLAVDIQGRFIDETAVYIKGTFQF